MKVVKVNSVFPAILAFVASAIMLTVIQAPISWSWLAWVALIPFILVCKPSAKPKSLMLTAYLISLCYWLGNLYWIGLATVSGWIAFCLYTAVLWPILAFCVRFCRIKKIPLFIAVPILFVGAERLQGLFLGGFFWRFLAHSQYANTTLIQIADIFGAAGISFLIAMVNGLLAKLIIAAGPCHPERSEGSLLLSKTMFLKTALVCAALAATIAYGRWRIGQSDKFIEAGPLVGLVQPNVPQSVKKSYKAEDLVFEQMLQNSSECFKAGAELVVWPETMVPATLDKRVLRLLEPSNPNKIFDKTISEHSKNNGFVLVGAYGGKPEITEDLSAQHALRRIHLTQKYNSAFLYKSNGKQANKQYNKIHLVPFGEFLPLRNWAFLYKLLMKFTPYDYDYSLDAGTEYTVFEMENPSGRKLYKFSVMICYEGTVPLIARRFAMDENKQKNLDWLVNISNDGWFVRFKNEKVFPSTQLAQHTAVYVFRAVENRLAVVRSVNTGISCLIDTTGRIRDGFAAGNLPQKAMARTGVAGWFVDKVPIDKRVTFFSRYGQWLDLFCAGGLVCLIIMPALKRIAEIKKSARSTK